MTSLKFKGQGCISPFKGRSHICTRSTICQFRRHQLPLSDWRVDEMVTKAEQYYTEIWTNGIYEHCNDLFGESFTFQDKVWGNGELVVGPLNMQNYVKRVRDAYPDLWFEIKQIGIVSWEIIFVLFEASGTNLGYKHGHKASKHNSFMSGVDLLKFCDKRQKLIEVDQFRQPTMEDKNELQGNTGYGTELKLVRLHYD
eukprot:TRINITY_DN1703_c1_g2_i1.p2 TRINITY_DN1703_c1_g2~~TRINITY_DN1703_c1_g2_i1.p2  ORF type:complete len:198 (-),score=6.76 TRINITY_DN1703_c1_g2_i1:298-891(-)